MNLSIIQKRAPDDDVKALVSALDEDLAGYAPEQHHGLDLNSLFRPNVSFYVAYLDDVCAGCGGLEFFAGFAELKRMYVKPEFRGTPLARSIIAHLEYVALARNHHHIKLETGNKQFAAMRFYEREGFKICAPFGEYLALSDFAIETSIFMEKAI
jgi:putative acetyltransferase